MAEGNIRGVMRYGPDEIHRRGRPFEFPKVIGPMLLDSLGIYGSNIWVFKDDLQEWNKARMITQCCVTSWSMLSRGETVVGVSKTRLTKKIKQW
jgi:hypothetical protein